VHFQAAYRLSLFSSSSTFCDGVRVLQPYAFVISRTVDDSAGDGDFDLTGTGPAA
jgi:hypothetical protein